MSVRSVSVVVLICLAAAGCVRRTSVHDFGLTGQPARHSTPSPDTSLRAIFQQQTKGAFNPLSDDARIRALRQRLQANPENVDSRLELAAVYEGYRLHDDALEQYTAAFDTTPSERALLGIVRCDQALNRSWRAIPL